jgi:hypothetical protein
MLKNQDSDWVIADFDPYAPSEVEGIFYMIFVFIKRQGGKFGIKYNYKL